MTVPDTAARCSIEPRSPPPSQEQSARTADLSGLPSHGVVALESEVGDGPEELFETDPKLHPGQVCPDAPVYPGAESEVPVGGPIKLQGVGLREGLLVEISGGEGKQHVLVFGDDLAVDRDVLGRDPYDRHRGEAPQQLLDGARPEGRVVDQALPSFGVLG